MRRFVGPIGCALILTLCRGGASALADGPTRDEANTPLTSVTKRPSFAFASTPAGLFRAPLATKRWERLTTPPGMPREGTFAAMPADSPLVLYIASKGTREAKPRPGDRYGLYVSRDDGKTWELASERDDFGPAVLLPDAGLFAITGYRDPFNGGDRLLRSTDLGKTWRDISGDWHVNLMGLEPDPDHPRLVRLHGWAFRSYTITADDENYRWKTVRGHDMHAGRRSSHDFFLRSSSSTNRFYLYQATLSNYFRYDFGNQKEVQALEVIPLKERFEFGRGARVVVPLRVVFHDDPDLDLARWQQAEAKGQHAPKPTPPAEKFADRPGGVDFWGIRVESPGVQVEKYPSGRNVITETGEMSPDGKLVTKSSQPPRVSYKAFDLSPSRPYEREIDLGRLFDFTKPGEYRVQLIYDSGGHPDDDKDVWDGSLTSPVFTVVVRE